MNWNDPPQLEVSMSFGDYFWNTVLGLFALAVLIVAAAIITTSEAAAGWILAAGGVILFAPAAFAYFRTVESGWHLPNVAVWAGLLLIGMAASFATYKIQGSYFDLNTLVPAGGTGLATLGAAGLDKVNEELANIPMAWSTVAGIGLIAVFFVAKARG